MSNSKNERRENTITIAEVMTPNMTNFTGNVHGGYLLSLLDKAAYACASRYCGGHVVTLSVDRVLFKEAIHVGELVTCLAKINYVGNTSMEIGIKVIAENIQSGIKRHTNTSYFTMVAVDENLKPIKVPALTPQTETDQRRADEAKLRKRISLECYQQHLARKAKEKQTRK